ncbi:thioesterase family protein [Fervidibacillus halotolerans]|uniref:Thioesterase n=1 Tax=Fervidibacillus halotolerans TaxID=2980027 RepID=A0A9E8LY15_9BACI|nr:hotdog domain-containing protein [Fervidibacillus halotolerans]WAA11843.1 thioesterase [Fervidibacillus halotolerans]
MKPGLAIGRSETISFHVTEEMYAQFEGKIVHPAYSTVSMVYHMEWVSRKIILPFLENDEEGMGASVKVKHIAPATLGTSITATAVVTKLDNRLVVTEVELSNGKEIIGKGEVVQVILPKGEIQKKLAKSNRVKKT